jgi:hypothetical protein
MPEAFNPLDPQNLATWNAWVVNTPTTIPVGIRLRAPRISSLRGSFGRQRQLWIFLSWTMLSYGAEGRIPSGEGTIVLGRRVSSD